MPDPTIDIQMDFSGTGTYTSILADIRAQTEVTAFWGNRQNLPDARVAETGNIGLVMNNAANNSAGSLGYYSPDHANLRSGFGVGTPLRIKVIDPAGTAGAGTVYNKYYVSDITPSFGQYGERTVQVGGVDYIDKMASQFAKGLRVLTSQRIDQALGTLIDTMPIAPGTEVYSTGPDTLDYLFYDVDSKNATVYNVAQRLAQSDLSYIFRDANQTDGESLVYEDRHDRLTRSSSGTLNDAMTDLSVKHTQQDIFNSWAIVVTPIDVGSTNEVIYTHQREISISPGGTITFDARYRDPDSGANSVRLEDGSGVTPVANTDYRMSSSSGGSGSELNANLSVTATYYADYVHVVLVNSAAATGYINLLQFRGHVIRIYDKAESLAQDTAANLDKYGDRPKRFALPYVDNPNTANDFANHLLTKWKAPQTQIDYVEFYANATAAKLTMALCCRIGHRVTIAETATGIYRDNNIIGVEWRIKLPHDLWCRWYLEPAGSGYFWLLGEAGASELGLTTYLGF